MDMPLKPIAELRSPALSEIASALGCSATDFLEASDTHPLAGANELLRLWAAAKSDADRERIIACARVVVGERGKPD